MFSHVTIGTNDLASSTNFYGRLLVPLGIKLLTLKHNPERALFTQSTTDSGCSGLMIPDTHLGENARQIPDASLQLDSTATVQRWDGPNSG